MKNKILSMALVVGAMAGISAQLAPNATKAAESRPVSEQSEPASAPTQKQQPATEARSTIAITPRYVWPDEVVASMNRKRGVRTYARNWSNSHSSGFNKVKHSRNTRRKHRRA